MPRGSGAASRATAEEEGESRGGGPRRSPELNQCRGGRRASLAEQGDRRGTHHSHVAQRAGRRAVVLEHHGLEVLALAEELALILARRTLDQHLHLAPYRGVVELPRDP